VDAHFFEGLEVHEVRTSLTSGSKKTFRVKFSDETERENLNAILEEVQCQTLPVGDALEGEIEVFGVKRIVTNRFWAAIEYSVLFPGKDGPIEGTYWSVRWHAGTESGTAALCITTDKRIILSRSYRHQSRAWRWEIPRGIRKPGETAEQCGFRESLEEAGVERTDETKVIDLGRIEPDSGLAMMLPSIVAYTAIKADPEKIRPDATEAVRGYAALTVQEVEDWIREGKIVDGYTIAAVFKARLHGLL
jgi:8-oxo-dGTP pyrophosphatase MutT (NUDIX family)